MPFVVPEKSIEGPIVVFKPIWMQGAARMASSNSTQLPIMDDAARERPTPGRFNRISA